MAEPLVLSGSSLNTFLRCAHQWELGYVRRIRRPPTLKQALGIAGHSAVEKDLEQKVRTRVDLPQDVVLDAFRDSFVREAHDAPETGDETKPGMLDSGVAAVKLWHGQVSPTYQPVMVEQHVQFKINGHVVDGTVDTVDEAGKIRDHKFVGKKPSSSDSYILNMTGYAIGYRRLTGNIESGIVLDHMVRTKVPQYVPITSEGPVKDQDIVAYAGIVDTVARTVEAGLFAPTGLKSNACSWCGYNDGTCVYYRK
jgi:hypothetical protein